MFLLLYKLNKDCDLNYIKINYLVLTKKNKKNIIKKRIKQQLIFLRAPKHFNIGKQRVKSLNYKAFDYLTKNDIYLKSINTKLIYDNYLFEYISRYFGLNNLYIINKLNVNIYTKIKF